MTDRQVSDAFRYSVAFVRWDSSALIPNPSCLVGYLVMRNIVEVNSEENSGDETLIVV